MHVYFSGIGGAGISPLALIAHQAGYDVSGSDMKDSSYVANLKSKGIANITIGQSEGSISKVHNENPIDWLVHSSAIRESDQGYAEIQYAKDRGITVTKRDEFINKILTDSGQKMIAVAGTHGKTTTTAMVIWLFRELEIPISYSLGGKLSFGGIGQFSKEAEYFIYEADEYDRNFLSFSPAISLITGIAYDHPDIYPTQQEYREAFEEFISQSQSTIIYAEDDSLLGSDATSRKQVLSATDGRVKLIGEVNRKDAWLAVTAVQNATGEPIEKLIEIINRFPGVSRRFEKISDNIYTDYAHTPEKIAGALQLTREISDNVVVVYEGLHNTRQHFIKDQLPHLFREAKKLYIVPSYRAREDENLEDLTPEKLADMVIEPMDKIAAALNDELKTSIENHVNDGDLVLCLSAGGGGSLDEWLRREFA